MLSVLEINLYFFETIVHACHCPFLSPQPPVYMYLFFNFVILSENIIRVLKLQVCLSLSFSESMMLFDLVGGGLVRDLKNNIGPRWVYIEI